jgi:FkbM family methyltransferase
MINFRNFIHDLSAPVRVKLENQRMFLNVRFKYFANSLGTFRSINTNEPRSVDFACRLQDLGVNSFLDIGSSFGVWSLPFLKYSQLNGYNVRVLAVDANPMSCHDLFKNAEHNEMPEEKISIVNAAVGPSNGYTVLHFPKYASNMGSVGSKNDTRRLFNKVIPVSIVDIDFFTKSFEPELVKIDVEGLDLILAAKIVFANSILKVLSVEVTPTNLLNGGTALLRLVAEALPFLIPIPKEAEVDQTPLQIKSIDEVIEMSNNTRKTNLFFFRDEDLAVQALSLINNGAH